MPKRTPVKPAVDAPTARKRKSASVAEPAKATASSVAAGAKTTRTRTAAANAATPAKASRQRRPALPEYRPHSVPTVEPESEFDVAADQPFGEGPDAMIDPELRQRLISDAAYRRYAERGFADGYDMEDWLEAEAEVDHLLVNRKAG